MKKYSTLIALAAVIIVAVLVVVLVVYLNSIEKGNNFTLGDYTVISQGAGVAIVSYDGDATVLTVPSKVEGKKIVDSIKFISLDYDIEINFNEKNEIKYNNLIKENSILSEDKIEYNNIDNGNDDNINFIGNKEEYFDNTVNNIKNIIEAKFEQFENMAKMMDIEEFILK